MENKKITELRAGLTKITMLPLEDHDNFYDLGIDSFSLVEIINYLETFTQKNHLKINFDALITEDTLSIEMIIKHLSLT